MVKDRITGILLLLCMVFTSGCRYDSAPDVKDHFTVGFSQCTDDLWRQIMMVQMRAEAAKYPGLELVVKNARNDTPTQIRQIQEFIDMGVDLLVISPNESEPITPIAVSAFDSGIPTIIWDRKIMSDHYTTCICADNYKIGRDVGQYIRTILAPESTILEITGLMSSSPAEERHRGFTEEASEIYSIHTVSGDWKPEKALEAVGKLDDYSSIDLIFAHNDDMALSAYNAIDAADPASARRIKFVGIDALVGVDAVLDGRLCASFLYPTGGDKVMEIAMKILSGQKVEKLYSLPTAFVDSTNAYTLKAQQEQILSYQEQINKQEKKIREYGDSLSTLKYSLWAVVAMAATVGFAGLYALRLNILLRRRNKILSAKNKEVEIATHNLMERHAQIENITASRLQLFTNITHEIRTPLTLILNPLDNILKKEKDQNIRHDIWIVQRNARHLLKIVNQILDIRKIENNKMTLSVSEVDIVRFLQEILNYFEAYAETEKIVYKFHSDIPAQKLWIDKGKIEQVFLNLLSNAFKYSYKYGMITVTVTDNISSVIVEVEDNGKGIAKEELPRIFDRFYSLASKSDKLYSTGIGLHLTKEYVEMHHGSITVNSEPGRYTVFRVELLKGKDHFGQEVTYEERRTDTLDSDISDQSKVNDLIHGKYDYTIVVAEDDPDILEYLGKELSENFNVIPVSNGFDALKAAREEQISLLLSDVLMPALNGFQLCEHIKSDLSTCHIPVVLLSALSENSHKLYGLAEGADEYISKPFDMNILKLKLIRILEERRKMAGAFSKRFSLMMIQDVTELPCPDEQFKEKFFNALEEEYRDSDFKIEAMSGKLGISRISLYRKISNIFDMTPSDMLRNYRLKKSLALLASEHKTVSEVAYETGFSSPAYFAKCFKALYNMTPTEYMVKCRKNN